MPIRLQGQIRPQQTGLLLLLLLLLLPEWFMRLCA
jgi:hypothetical protein